MDVFGSADLDSLCVVLTVFVGAAVGGARDVCFSAEEDVVSVLLVVFVVLQLMVFVLYLLFVLVLQ